MQPPPPDTPSALYKVGDKLVLAAPAHTGLPNGAAAMVISLHPFERASGWCYGVTLMGCGADGSGIGAGIDRCTMLEVDHIGT
jgi:hypothetical protein